MKNKIVVVAMLGILLMANGFGTNTSSQVWAASSDVKIILNGQVLNTDPNSTYLNGSTVMIPLRETSNALKFKTNYQKNTGIIQLVGVKDKIEFKVGEDYITVNDTDKRVYKDNIVIKSERLYVPLSFFNAIGLVTAYDVNSNLVEIYSPEVTANAIAVLLTTGQFQVLSDRFFSEELKRSIPVTGIQKRWEEISGNAGNYHGIKATKSNQQDERFSIQSVLDFANVDASLVITLNKSGKIIDLQEKLLIN